jgi:hypothetical protein
MFIFVTGFILSHVCVLDQNVRVERGKHRNTPIHSAINGQRYVTIYGRVRNDPVVGSVGTSTEWL